MPTVTLPFEVETQAPYLNIRISNSHDDYESRLTSALLDTGADSSTVPHYLAKALMHRNHDLEPEPTDIFGVDGNKIEVYKHSFNLKILDSNGEDLFEITEMRVDVPCSQGPMPPQLYWGERTFF